MSINLMHKKHKTKTHTYAHYNQIGQNQWQRGKNFYFYINSQRTLKKDYDTPVPNPKSINFCLTLLSLDIEEKKNLMHSL